MSEIQQYIDVLNGLDFKGMYGSDFLHTWDKTTDELRALYATAAALRNLRERNISPKIFDSGLAVSLFRDNSTCSALSFRTWTRRSPRSPTARPSARRPTWCPSWPTSSASGTICSSARATSIRPPSWTP